MPKTIKKVSKPKKTTTPKVSSANKAKLLSMDNQMEEIAVPLEIFGKPLKKALIAQAVRVYLSRQRSAHAATKVRALVDRTKKKLYRQKGTGGARHGARSAPLFVGGGRAHGPKKEENYYLGLPKRMGKEAFLSALSDKFKSDKVFFADIENIEPKTKIIKNFLAKNILEKVTLVHSGKNKNITLAARNLSGVELIRADLLNTYSVIKSRSLLITKEAIEILKMRGVIK